MGSGIKGLKKGGIRDHSLGSGITASDPGSQPSGSGSACFPLTQGSTYTGINKILWDQGSKFSSLLGSGIKKFA